MAESFGGLIRQPVIVMIVPGTCTIDHLPASPCACSPVAFSPVHQHHRPEALKFDRAELDRFVEGKAKR
jgi:hypothetical protein